jgi:hypothetical protein
MAEGNKAGDGDLFCFGVDLPVREEQKKDKRCRESSAVPIAQEKAAEAKDSPGSQE